MYFKDVGYAMRFDLTVTVSRELIIIHPMLEWCSFQLKSISVREGSSQHDGIEALEVYSTNPAYVSVKLRLFSLIPLLLALFRYFIKTVFDKVQ